MIKSVIKIILLMAVIAGLFSCETTRRLSDRNLDFLYDEATVQLKPQYKIFHHSKDSSTVYFRISPEQLLYEQQTERHPFQADYKIKYKLFDSYSTREVRDSVTKVSSDTVMYDSGDAILDSMVVSVPDGNKYVMYLKITDINSDEENSTLLAINKTGDGNLQYYKIYDENDSLRFTSMIGRQKDILLQYKKDVSQNLNVSIYTKAQPAAYPPFVEDAPSFPEIIPDTTFQISLKDGVGKLPARTKGFYRIHHGEEPDTGASIYFFHEGYPYVDNKHLLLPLRYLTTGDEFKKIKEHPDTVDAVDIFWTTIAGTPLRGGNVAGRYYDHVQKSNKYFTTWKEGWKTDRGMIYSVFGPPDHIVRNDDSERWTYQEDWQFPETTFRFVKTEAPAGETCYQLQRHNEFRSSWFQVVEKIRR